MKDGYSGDGTRKAPADQPRLTRLGHELPDPKPRGLFRRKPIETTPDLNEDGSPRLRVVPAPEPRARVETGDDWAALRSVPAVCADPGADVTASFDMLRTRLARQLAEQGWNRVAVVAPTGGCGATFTAVHLALSFARLPGQRALLMDLNQRRPGAAAMLGVRGHGDLRGFLVGRAPVQDHVVRLGDTLAAGFVQAADPDGPALLHGQRAALALGTAMDRLAPDVMICDLPPMLESDDLLAILPQVDGVLLVADGHQTRPGHIAACERQLAGQTRVLGVALNQALRAGPAPAQA